MAANYYAYVYFQDSLAGILREEPGNRMLFTYERTYLESGLPAIAYSLPLQEQAHISIGGKGLD